MEPEGGRRSELVCRRRTRREASGHHTLPPRLALLPSSSCWREAEGPVERAYQVCSDPLWPHGQQGIRPGRWLATHPAFFVQLLVSAQPSPAWGAREETGLYSVQSLCFFTFFFFFNVYLFFERQRETEWGRGRELEGVTDSETGSGL